MIPAPIQMAKKRMIAGARIINNTQTLLEKMVRTPMIVLSVLSISTALMI
jgi:hypothetical protein